MNPDISLDQVMHEDKYDFLNQFNHNDHDNAPNDLLAITPNDYLTPEDFLHSHQHIVSEEWFSLMSLNCQSINAHWTGMKNRRYNFKHFQFRHYRTL